MTPTALIKYDAARTAMAEANPGPEAPVLECLPTGISKSDPAAGSRSAVDENPPILKMFEREDWTLFRTVEGLQQKAGVPAKLLRRLVLKELGDNALDTGAGIKFGPVARSPDKFSVEDNGPGIDGTPEEIAELFSIRRPMRSSNPRSSPRRRQYGRLLEASGRCGDCG